MIKRSSKFQGKDYYHEKRHVSFVRIWGGIGWPGDQPGALVVIGEEDYFNVPHWYILAEASSNRMDELIRAANKLTGEFSVDCWYGRHAGGSEEFLKLKNYHAFDVGTRQLDVYEAPGPKGDEKIMFHVNVILDCVSPEPKTLHFFNDSSLPAELQGLPNQLHRLTNIECPAVAALGYVVSALADNPHEENLGYYEPPPMPNY